MATIYQQPYAIHYKFDMNAVSLRNNTTHSWLPNEFIYKKRGCHKQPPKKFYKS